jgi:lipopolysaccharide biosynthesis glycosyltransferase
VVLTFFARSCEGFAIFLLFRNASMSSSSSATQPSTIEVAFGSDAGYLQHLTVAVASVLGTSKKPSNVRFWLVTRTLTDSELAPLRTMIEEAGAQFEVRLPASEVKMDGLPLLEHCTEATYYRLLIPQLLPANVTRVIYLDSDVIVRQPIEELWKIALGEHSTGAVLNPRPMNYQQLGLRREKDYFNAGVLLMDLSLWRKRHIHERALAYAAARPGQLPCADQDALNHVLCGAWKRLDLRWNQQSKFFQHSARHLGVSWLALWRARTSPYVVHYSTSTKPWHADNDHPWRSLYFEHLDRTHHEGWRPAGFGSNPPSGYRLGRLHHHCRRGARAVKSLVNRRLRTGR